VRLQPAQQLLALFLGCIVGVEAQQAAEHAAPGMVGDVFFVTVQGVGALADSDKLLAFF
jgi:hypothetical protein